MWPLSAIRSGNLRVSKVPSKKRYDYIVVGGGTGGCLLARALAKGDPSKSTLLVEAGSGNISDFFHPVVRIPSGYLLSIGNKKLDYCFNLEAEANLEGRKLRYPRGKQLGGCSILNGMLWSRPFKDDYKAFVEAAGEIASSSSSTSRRREELEEAKKSWTIESCLEDFREIENHWIYHDKKERSKLSQEEIKQLEKSHGSKGCLRVERNRFHYPILKVMEKAFVEYGMKTTIDFNPADGDHLNSVAFYDTMTQNGSRLTTANAFLGDAFSSSSSSCCENLEVVTGCGVGQIKFSNTNGSAEKKAQGVRGRVLKTDEQFDVDANQEIILTAGALHTPLLLQVSGIGDKKYLQDVIGIDKVFIDNPDVGQNLEDHLQLRCAYALKKSDPNLFLYNSGGMTLNKISRSLFGVAGIAKDYLFNSTGPLVNAPSQLCSFMETPQTKGRIQFHVQPLSLPAFGEWLDPFESITLSVLTCNPTSTGTVHATRKDILSSSGVEQQPIRIQANYLSTEFDKRMAAESIQVSREVMSQNSLQYLEPEEFVPGKQKEAEEDLQKSAAKCGTTIFHPTCTAKMGKVVDHKLRVLGVENLRIADASVFPKITSANTVAPVLLVANKCAKWILEERLK